MACLYYVRQFKDKDACFILLKPDARGVVPFYSSSSFYSRDIGYGDEDYQALVGGTVPATIEQTVEELDDYAVAVNAPRRKPNDWPTNGLAWPFQYRRSKSCLYPEVMLVDVRTNVIIAACSGLEEGSRELYTFAHALEAVRST